MADDRTELLQGTLDLLVLKTLTLGSTHGWGIAQRIQQNSREQLRVNQGSLYPALQRLSREGWVETDWGLAENNRRVKIYQLTPAGRRQLAAEERSWARFTDAVGLILRTT